MGESPGKMYAMSVILTLLATAAVTLRFYARYLKKAGYSWDEHTILLALVGLAKIVAASNDAQRISRYLPLRLQYASSLVLQMVTLAVILLLMLKTGLSQPIARQYSMR